jgi:hypothetical protein
MPTYPRYSVPAPYRPENEAAAVERLEPVLASDRHMHFVVAERRRKQIDQASAVLEEPQHVLHPAAGRELGLREDVLDAVGVDVVRPCCVVIL